MQKNEHSGQKIMKEWLVNKDSSKGRTTVMKKKVKKSMKRNMKTQEELLIKRTWGPKDGTYS